MKPNTDGGAGHHDAEGVPTGLDRKARRALHAAADKFPYGNIPRVKMQARTYLDRWTDNKLDYKRIIDLVDDAHQKLLEE